MRTVIKLTIVVLLVSCTSKKQLEIVPLSPYYKVETKHGKTIKSIYFLVKHWEDQNSRQYDTLNEFSDVYKLSDTTKCNICSIYFYKESNRTNEEYRESESDFIDWHSKDLVFSKEWQGDKVVYIQRFKNGKVIDTSDVRIIDIRIGN